MPTPTAERDLARAKDLRATAKTISNAAAKQAFLEAADRLEGRAAKSARKLARRPKRAATALTLPH